MNMDDEILERERADRALERGDSAQTHLDARPLDPCSECGYVAREVEPGRWVCPCDNYWAEARRNHNGAHPTAEPERSPYPPLGKLPLRPGIDSTVSSTTQHWRKHPSDYHADCAISSLGASLSEPDSLRRDHQLRAAEVHATLSLRDAVLELAAVKKHEARKAA